MRVLGIDCGGTATGFGLVAFDGARHRAVVAGTIRPPRAEPAERLQWIHSRITTLLEQHRPEWVAIEDVFYARNVRSSLRLSQIRGVAMQAAAACAVPVASYSPLEVKSAVTGYGRAAKTQVQFMVKALLALTEAPDSTDASDALAVAICHIHHHTTRERLAGRAAGVTS